jgi:hypothetical protein
MQMGNSVQVGGARGRKERTLRGDEDGSRLLLYLPRQHNETHKRCLKGAEEGVNLSKTWCRHV